MRAAFHIVSAVALAATGGSIAWLAGGTPLRAADHLDPPARTDPSVTANPDFAIDIADVYLFPTATSVVVSIGFAGPRATNIPAMYDRDVNYQIFLSNAGSQVDPEISIEFRFGQDATNPAASGVRVTGLPGTATPLVGPVESTLTTANGVKVYAGLIDDPFNFDVIGFRQTRDTGTLAFNNQRNFFAGLNTTAIVIEIPRALIENGTNKISAWARTSRIIPA